MHKLFLSLALLFSLNIFSQDDVTPQSNDVVFTIVETMPIFPGCVGLENKVDINNCFNNYMRDHLINNFEYPLEARKLGIEGKVFVEFVFSSTGLVRDVKVIKGVHSSLDNAAVEIIKKIPKFIPGTQRGKNVSVKYVIPISYKLS